MHLHLSYEWKIVEYDIKAQVLSYLPLWSLDDHVHNFFFWQKAVQKWTIWELLYLQMKKIQRDYWNSEAICFSGN